MTGGLVARTVERARWWRRRPAHDDDVPHGSCLDCATPLVGAHCHRCGQAAHLHRTMGGFAHEVLHGVFHFEGRIWRTLPMLAVRPGHLTRRYVDGERTKFVSPMASFLFSVFLLFAIVAQLPAFTGSNDLAQDFDRGLTGAQVTLADQAAAQRKRIATLEAGRARLAANGAPTTAADAAIEAAQEELAGLEKVIERLPAAAEGGPQITARLKDGRPAGAEARNWFRAKLDHARGNPGLFVYKMKSTAYKYSWALIPISLPFIWLMFFWKRRFGLYDHAVFATYSLAFMSLLVVVLSVVISYAGSTAAGIAWWALFAIPPVHMYKQLRYAYLLRRFGAAWRTAMLLLFVTVSAVLFFLFLLYLGAAD